MDYIFKIFLSVRSEKVDGCPKECTFIIISLILVLNTFVSLTIGPIITI